MTSSNGTDLYMYRISGVISCNGEDGTTNVGGSSGGSVKLTTGTLNGKGRIEVNGGKGKQKKSLSNSTNITRLRIKQVFGIKAYFCKIQF